MNDHKTKERKDKILFLFTRIVTLISNGRQCRQREED
jgi:hypothetical protein